VRKLGKTPMWRRYLTFWGRDIDRDLYDEVEFHIEARARELIDAGWTPEAARNEARRLFGDPRPILSKCRWIDSRFEKEKRMTRYLEDLKSDVRFAFRQFQRQPKFWAVIILTLVIGIAAGTNIFAVVDGVLLKPLPYSEPERLVRLITGNLRGEFFHLSQLATTMDLAAYYPLPREVTVNAGEPARLVGAGVTAGFFELLGARPALGRTFTVDETRPGGPGIVGTTHWRTYGLVILSTGVWQTYFGGSPTVIGRTLTIEGVPHTIVGVMPADFDFPFKGTGLWFPHSIDPANLWAGNVATMIGRLRPGYGLEEARQELRTTLVPSLRKFLPQQWGNVDKYGADFDVRPLAGEIVGSARSVLLVLLAAVGVVLLVLCVNVANLLLARGMARDRELATRAALGAGRRRLVRQLVSENLAVALVSGALGILVSWASLRMLVAFLPADMPRIEQIQMDVRTLLFALGLSILTSLAFGLLPAIRVTRRDRGLLSRGTGGVQAEAREGRLTRVLATLEFSLAVVLVVSAALLLQSLWNLAAVDPGFRVDQLMTARVSPPGFPDQTASSRRLFAERLIEKLQTAPGVKSAAIANAIPFDSGLHGTMFQINARPRQDGRAYYAAYFGVSPAYLETMGIPILEGRGFTEQDRIDSPRVALVSRSAAKEYWGGESPVGHRIMFFDQRQYPDAAGDWRRWFTIVGVVDDVQFNDLASASPKMVYLPIDQYWDMDSLRLVIRTPDDPSRVATGLRAIVSSVDPSTPVSDIRTYEARLGDVVARPRFAAYLLTAFAAIALFLATLGVYGVLSYTLSRRIPEIAVRLAFGASGRDVFTLLFGQGVRLTLAGLAVGIPATMAATRLLSGLLFGVQPTDLRLFATVVLILFAAGFAASYFPARRAARIDAMTALRQD